MEPDFRGYATRYGIRCADGRTIVAHAFQGNDSMQVPLVWQHLHDSTENVLGHVVMHAVNEGVRVDGYFNDTPNGLRAKKLVRHKDLRHLSIYANQLIQQALNVTHGVIREVSLVLSGANPGATIDDVNFAHGDGGEGEAIICMVMPETEIELAHSASPVPAKPDLASIPPSPAPAPAPVTHAVDGAGTLAPATQVPSSQTVEEVLNTFTPIQREVLYGLLGQALSQGSAVSQSGTTPTDQKDGEPVTRNVFDQTDAKDPSATPPHKQVVLSHADVKGIIADAMRCGSLKEAVTGYALQHNIDNIDLLFPDARNLQNEPEFVSRRTEWVAGVLAGTRKSPFARVKTILADITMDEARAKGYIKGDVKQEEFFGVSRRTTTPTTVYKKQKLDRDDVIDITELDVITFIKGEMRLMLEEEIARAILIGDGREITDADKVKDPAGAADGAGIRSILNDHDMYVTTVRVNIDDASSTPDEIVDGVVKGMRYYHGTGMPTLYTTLPVLTTMILAKDDLGRRLYATQAELAAAMMVRNIVTVEPMETVASLLGIVVNLGDYNCGTDRGGEINTFDDFDIDFNQLKYLIETRLSGALVKYKAALVVMKTAAGDVLIDPVTAPTYNKSTFVVTIPTLAHVVYKNADTGATLNAGAQAALAEGATLNVIAVADSGYFFETDAADEWSFYRRPL